MGSKKSGILEKIKEGDQIGRKAIEVGEKLEGDGREIKSLLNGIDTSMDEDDASAVKAADHEYDISTKAAFKEDVETKESEMEEWLLYYHDVSREHFYIEPRTSGIGATITDVSSFGTYLNGNRIRKNSPQFITSGTEIRLASSATMKFVIKGE